MKLEQFTSKQLASEVMGDEAIRVHGRVHSFSMMSADTIREIIAFDLDGGIDREGKNFLVTPEGEWRVAIGGKSDNSTEAAAHAAMGVGLVQVLGPISVQNRERGAITLAALYKAHGKSLDEDAFIRRVREAHGV